MGLRTARRATAVLGATLLVGLGWPALKQPAQAAPAVAQASAQPALGPAPAPGPAPTAYRHGPVPTVAAAQARAAQSQAASANNLLFGGGNGGVGVTTGAPRVYLVFWGSQWGTQSTNAEGFLALSGDPNGMAPDLQGFMKGLGTGSETWSGVMTEYCEGVATAAQSCPANAAHVGYPTGGALAGVWADTATAAPPSASGHQLAVEAVNAANHFGNTGQASNRSTQYFIISAPGATPDGFNTASGQFCAWHDFSGDPTLPGGGAVSSPFAVAFTNMPYLTDAGTSCGMHFVNSGPGGTLDGVTIVGGHEYAETITDQFPNGGWLDRGQNENGDKCAWIGAGQGASQDITLATGSFPVQSTWANDFSNGNGGCVVSHPVVVNSNLVPPLVSSASAVSFTAGVPGTFTVTTTGPPAPTIGETGPLPTGVGFTDNHDGTATLAGTAAAGLGGSYPLTLTAANGVGNDATQAFTLAIKEAPSITSASSTTFTVGVAGSFTVAARGFPAPTVIVSGTLPPGVTFNTGTTSLSGAPAQASAGSYPLTFNATNGIGVVATMNFTLTVNQATLTYPSDGQGNVDTTVPFTWSTIPQAQAYYLIVGSAAYTADLVNSGVLPSSQLSLAMPALPAGPPLHATLFAQVNGAWTSYQAITFTAAAGLAMFTFPVNGQTGIDATKAFTWSTIPQAQGYILVVGTSRDGTNLAISGVLPPTQSSYTTPALPPGQVLYATLLTKINGAWSRSQSVVFTVGATAMGSLSLPVNGQLNVPTPTTFRWTPVAGAQNYYLVVGTTLYGSDLVNSGLIAPTVSSLNVGALLNTKLLFATLFTLVNGTWVFQVVGFTAS